ncbi:hypothetical protein ACQJBY_044539 [Aegilops geniculata]
MKQPLRVRCMYTVGLPILPYLLHRFIPNLQSLSSTMCFSSPVLPRTTTKLTHRRRGPRVGRPPRHTSIHKAEQAACCNHGENSWILLRKKLEPRSQHAATGRPPPSHGFFAGATGQGCCNQLHGMQEPAGYFAASELRPCAGGDFFCCNCPRIFLLPANDFATCNTVELRPRDGGNRFGCNPCWICYCGRCFLLHPFKGIYWWSACSSN